MDDRLLVGADLGGTKLLLVAFNRVEHVTHRVATGPGTCPELVEREVRSFLARLATPAALGIAVPCLVDNFGAATGCGTFPRPGGGTEVAGLNAPADHYRTGRRQRSRPSS